MGARDGPLSPCVFVTGGDALYADFVKCGGGIPWPPQDSDYGMRDLFSFGMARRDRLILPSAVRRVMMRNVQSHD